MRYLTITLFCFLLTACGLRPLSTFENQNAVLTSITLGEIKGENSYLITNYLSNALNFYNKNSPQLYILDVHIDSLSSNAIIQKDSVILEKMITTTATYKLKDIKTLKILETKTIVTRSNFTNTTSPYGSYVQEQKSYKDTLKASVHDIKKHLLLFFAKKYKSK